MTVTTKKRPTTGPTYDARLAALEEQVSFLMKGRPGRKFIPIIVSQAHVCGVDPNRDSSTCPDASLWRRNKGCKGDACVARSTAYYQQYRASKKQNGDAQEQ